MHTHDISQHLITGQVSNIQNVANSRYKSLGFNGKTYYFVPGCGMDQLTGEMTLFVFPIRLDLTGGNNAQRCEFCMLPPKTDHAQNALLLDAGKNGCVPRLYVKEVTATTPAEIDVFRHQIGSNNYYCVICPFIDEDSGMLQDGIVYRFPDSIVKDTWDAEIQSHLRKGGNYEDFQASVEIPATRSSPNTPYDWSPVVCLRY